MPGLLRGGPRLLGTLAGVALGARRRPRRRRRLPPARLRLLLLAIVRHSPAYHGLHGLLLLEAHRRHARAALAAAPQRGLQPRPDLVHVGCQVSLRLEALEGEGGDEEARLCWDALELGDGGAAAAGEDSIGLASGAAVGGC